jgi:polyhydroxyalkanoate synthase
METTDVRATEVESEATEHAYPGEPEPPRSSAVDAVDQRPEPEESPGREPPEPLFGGLSDQTIDRQVHAALARATFGISPTSLLEAFGDWAMHLAISPGKQAMLLQKALRKAVRLGNYARECATDPNTSACIDPLAQDKRFSDEAWQRWPYNLIYQSFLLTQQWWHNATTEVSGVSEHHEKVVSFVVRQLLDLISPSNFPFINPEILAATLKEGGANLRRGAVNLVEDWERRSAGKPPVGAEQFVPGETVAVTKGKVVYRNELIELIQYAPKTDKVRAEPILIVPAWIMKYYILDLSPHNSLVKYLVGHGHTVFIISWKNPGSDDRDLDLGDYRRLGINRSLDAITRIVPDQAVHGVGYCLGGTLLSIAAATMARNGDQRLKTLTLLAAEIDFSEAGELNLFIDDSQVRFLEDMMWEQGYLDTKQMAGTFQLLRSNDLVWSRMVRDYLLGERRPMSDLMAWNADATRMPYRMHSEYLRKLFLNNDLAEGRYQVDGRPIAITDLRVPIFAVATVKDHVAPWKSVYKINLLSDTEVTFLLTNGGHNAGIVSEPGHHGRRYQVAVKQESDRYVDPQTWRQVTSCKDGSWWPEWQTWLTAHNDKMVDPPGMGAPDEGYAPLCDAPGTYVLQH